jgi:hypothetical protein
LHTRALIERRRYIRMEKSCEHIFNIGALAFITSALILGIGAWVFTFPSEYLFSLILGIGAITLIVPASVHARSYGQFPCMTGMMIGMTMGMLAGMLLGFVVGTTNGMFWGGVAGIVVGIGYGIWNGKCCGLMGIMEGTMAGLMGGLMGAMTALMTLTDHLRTTGILLLSIGALITGCFHRLVIKESNMHEKKDQQAEEYRYTLGMSTLLTLALILMIVLGPRGGLHV